MSISMTEQEVLDIYTSSMEHIGTATREEVHRRGYWHQTFHCWLWKRENDTQYLLFQLRSAHKRDFPNLLDITAAGHLLAGETPLDGLREVQEEIGIDLNFAQLHPVGVIKVELTGEDLLNYEFCHVYLAECPMPLDDFSLQADEVAGMFQIAVADFAALFYNKQASVQGEGYTIDQHGNKNKLTQAFTQESFVPIDQHYGETLLQALSKLDN